MKLSIFLPLAAFLTMSAAEIGITNECISPCLNHCLNESAMVAGCISQYDTDCTCPSVAFKDNMQMCLKIDCTPEDAEKALDLHKERCGTPAEE
ncbi:uncharacterized protein N7482_010501 [Penicillium canariense]|uniref:CFEM domain-containing protein n=1 Tax=Penicillium canariense TaxID=189055 RepID=A0A9W9HLN0_9EURO|nr:uncharacterized protein N7482_010501 [Penicillium canariense]KAJ5151249.1 hypothetical protein N7482_010501 [Penicillium canariense]